MQMIERIEVAKQEIKQKLLDYLLDQGIKVDQYHRLHCINPMHPDKHPSANIFPGSSAPLVFCHSCGTVADTFTAATLLENKPASGPEWLTETLYYLAKKLNIDIPEIELSDEERREMDAYRAYQDAAGIIVSGKLSAKTKAKLDFYMWNSNVQKDLGIGGVESFQAYKHQMTSVLKHDPELLRQIDLLNPGIFHEKNLIFTIKDERGNPVGFGARDLDYETLIAEYDALDPEEKKMAFRPSKYINTKQDNPIYRKGSRLFGLHRAVAKKDVRKIYVFEGYSDASTAINAGLNSSVALGSTRLSEDHVALLKRLKIDHIIFVLDADEAGTKGTEANLHMIEQYFGGHPGLKVQIVDLPPGSDDPDKFIRENGLKAFHDLAPKDIFQWRLERAVQKGEDRILLAEKTVPFIANETNPIRQHLYTEQLSEISGIPAHTLAEALRQITDAKESQASAELNSIGTRLLKQLQQDPSKVGSILPAFTTQVELVSSRFQKNINVKTILDYLDDLFEEFEDPNIESMLKTGWPIWDKVFGGIPRGGAFVGVPGKPNSGKSSLLCNLAGRLLDFNPECKVLYHTVDDNLKLFTPRLLSTRFQVSTNLFTNAGKMLKSKAKIRSMDGRLVQFEEIYNDARVWLKNYVSQERICPIDINFAVATLPSLERQIKRLRESYPDAALVVFMDNFHLYQDTQNRDGEISTRAMSMACKTLVNRYNVTIIATMELPKQALQPGQRPRLINIKGSSGMSYDANVNIGVYNDLKDFRENAALTWNDSKQGQDGNMEYVRKPILEMVFDKSKVNSFDGNIYYRMDPDSGNLMEESESAQIDWAKKAHDSESNRPLPYKKNVGVYVPKTKAATADYKLEDSSGTTVEIFKHLQEDAGMKELLT